MIDKEAGEVRLGPNFRIGPSTSRDEFLGSTLGESATLLVDNEPYCSWRVVGQLTSDGEFNAALYFCGQHLSQVHLSLGGSKWVKSWDDWSKEEAFKKKREHDALLEKWLSGERSFSWGTVTSTYDEKAAFSAIFLVYFQAANNRAASNH